MSERSIYFGPSFLSLLTLLFIGLKLGDVIDWSWWVVLCPLWGAWISGLVLIGTAAMISARSERKP